MCLAVPGKIISMIGEGLTLEGQVRFGPIQKMINLAFVENAKVGDYVIVHAGVAISILDEEEAQKTLACYEGNDE